MQSFRSEVIRLTVPVSAELSERLSVMAYLNDLTRSQYVRRALDAYIADSMVDWARLLDMDVDRWYADARKRWRSWHRADGAFERERGRDVKPLVETEG